jgi:hypothetical protein
LIEEALEDLALYNGDMMWVFICST